MHSFVGKRALVAAFGTIAMLSACKDKRVQAVNAGITRDSLLSVIGKDGPPGMDSLPNVYTRERYLVDGKNWEVFYFASNGKHLTAATKDTLPWKDLTPIVIVDRVVLGKDWAFWDSVATAHKFAVHPH
ncbi:MAG: hypothetical protein ABI601_17060 [bacterium]